MTQGPSPQPLSNAPNEPGFPPDALPAASPSNPWSGTAISGFVLSLIGCAGITAILGFILGIFGIVATRDGQRRGRGLAVAAIPISLVTGVLSILMLFAFQMGTSVRGVHKQLSVMLGGDTSRSAEAVEAFRELCSDDFNDAVSDEGLIAWLSATRAAHGTLASLQRAPARSGEAISFYWEGKFVKGMATIKTAFAFREWRLKLDDIEVDGSSPRP